MAYTFTNPVLGGDYADPTILRVGSEYYLTHSSNRYAPGLVIWRSRDLVNWSEVAAALPEPPGDVWAPDLVFHDGRFYIYGCSANSNWVVTAEHIEGPWSAPVDLKVPGIDPGHVVGPDGRRYLHLDNGYIVDLAPDGLSVVGEKRKVYDGWAYPDTWRTEGFCLESSKLTYRQGYYYLTVAQGGTGGPATSHMIVSARSRTPWGPWENSPHNPVIRTASADEAWWSRGHGTLVDTPAGEWWIVYHAYENGHRTLGRRTLLEPVEWTADGWFRTPAGSDPGRALRCPDGADVVQRLPGLSDDFSGPALRLQWRLWGAPIASRCRLGERRLVLQARGRALWESMPVVCMPQDHAYEVSAHFTFPERAGGGLILFYDPGCHCGIEINQGRLKVATAGANLNVVPCARRDAWFKIVNRGHVAAFFLSEDGRAWREMADPLDVSSYHHNHHGGFVGLRAGFYALGEGEVEIRDFRYAAL